MTNDSGRLRSAGLRPEPEEVSALRAAVAIARFVLRRWDVSVEGYGNCVELTTTRGKALASAWRNDIFNGYTFGEFLKRARCRLSDYQPTPQPITVLGKPAFYIDHNNQYVQFAWPDGEFVLNAHPYDVEPESFRPNAYRTADTPNVSGLSHTGSDRG